MSLLICTGMILQKSLQQQLSAECMLQCRRVVLNRAVLDPPKYEHSCLPKPALSYPLCSPLLRIEPHSSPKRFSAKPSMGTPLLTGTQGALEYYVHACPTRIRSEMQTVFRGVDTSKLLIIPTCQHSVENLVQMGEKIEDEKDRLLISFMEWAGAICKSLEAQGHWSDYIDPCSGLPMIHTENQQVYSEVDGLSVLMGFQTANAGCCKVLLHPVWGTNVYPASLFTTAPFELLAKAIEDRITA